MKASAVHPLSLQRGMTLLELMVAVAIVGIISAVAVPQYKDYVRRSQLPEAFSALSDYRIKMEQYYQDNRKYGASSCADTNPPAWNDFAPSGAKYFTYACTLSNSGQGFKVTATGVSTTQSNGHIYSLDFNNEKTTTKFKNTTVSKTCWLAKGDEC